MKDRPDTSTTNNPEHTSGNSLLCRLYWFAIGNVIVVLLAMKIVTHKIQIPFLFDFFYWLAAISLIVTRFIDIRYLNGQTVESEPATMTHWKKYAVGVFLISLCIWIIAHVIRRLIGIQ